ncbi:MAG: DUF2510 domain-containing protein [Acidimicrobiales bacterium]|nr:DUF2510 domain-containing protein [Acidimicrobiales bacterium]
MEQALDTMDTTPTTGNGQLDSLAGARPSYTGHPPADDLVHRIVVAVDGQVGQRLAQWGVQLAELQATIEADRERMRREHERLLARLDDVVEEVTVGLDRLAVASLADAERRGAEERVLIEAALADAAPEPGHDTSASPPEGPWDPEGGPADLDLLLGEPATTWDDVARELADPSPDAPAPAEDDPEHEPGWYRDPDPLSPVGTLRWWTGRHWTDHTRLLTLAPHLGNGPAA